MIYVRLRTVDLGDKKFFLQRSIEKYGFNGKIHLVSIQVIFKVFLQPCFSKGFYFLQRSGARSCDF